MALKHKAKAQRYIVSKVIQSERRVILLVYKARGPELNHLQSFLGINFSNQNSRGGS